MKRREGFIGLLRWRCIVLSYGTSLRRAMRILQEEPPSSEVPAKLPATTLGDRLGSTARCTRAPWDNSQVGSCSNTTQMGGWRHLDIGCRDNPQRRHVKEYPAMEVVNMPKPMGHDRRMVVKAPARETAMAWAS